MLVEKREKFKKIEVIVGKFFSRFLTPNQYTMIAPWFALVCLFFLIKQNLFLALVSFFWAAFIDFVDGAVARTTQQATKTGAYLDTVFDRYVEGIILVGFLFLPLPRLIFPAKFWVFVAFFGSIMTTYAKAAAKEKGLVTQELKRGLVGRGERMILVFLAMLLGTFNLSLTLYLIVIIAFLTNLTALQRIYLALK